MLSPADVKLWFVCLNIW